ncbi:hypothetical protein NQ315_014205 [Exocentrus adspersus]|uniref:Uncharacterized protein n=1 Tax=Exocentrus adspersus TaxID=1586481 RepID=A0AAV8VB97_9CUCU|nr:hypothetical protein NQ315_014205 [Exocentrus adspersus]
MFKLESYITPILLSYVDRYINNFKPEDSQVNLSPAQVILRKVITINDLTLCLDKRNASENIGQRRQYNTSWDHHMATNTESVLLERTPALAFDYVYQMEIPSDMSSDILSDLGSDREYSNLSETANMRVCFGPFRLRICSGFFHRLSTLQMAAAHYDYPPYFIVKPDLPLQDLLPPSEEDFDALNEFIPSRSMRITFFAPTIELELMDHPYFQPTKGTLFRRRKKLSTPSPSPQSVNLPKLTIECQFLDISLDSPMYVNRVVHTTCQLPDPPPKMFKACFSWLNVKVVGVGSRLILNPECHTTILTPSSISYSCKSILKPQYWTNPNIPHEEVTFESESITLNGTNAKMMVIAYIIGNENPALEWNNLEQGQPNMTPNLNLWHVTEKFDISIVAAPAMVYKETTIICGHSIEVNLVTDIFSVSATQKLVTISGQLTISNLLMEHFELKVVEAVKNNKEAEFRSSPTYVVSGKSSTPSIFINNKKNYILRLRFYGLESAWTGDIPLREHASGSQPWLVKAIHNDNRPQLFIENRLPAALFCAQSLGDDKVQTEVQHFKWHCRNMKVNLTVADIQLDNQLYSKESYDFPVGLTGLGVSLLGAVGGIAHHPLQSVITDGASPRSLAAGVGLGLVGVVTKPLSGAAELCCHQQQTNTIFVS